MDVTGSRFSYLILIRENYVLHIRNNKTFDQAAAASRYLAGWRHAQQRATIGRMLNLPVRLLPC
jgi:hypothetical protein